MDYVLKQPSPEQCSSNALLYENDNVMKFAMWFPQMGGYCSVSVVTIDKHASHCKGNPCYDVDFWHDGDFPYDNLPPRNLHFCNSVQLRRMADDIDNMSIIAGHTLDETL